MIGSKDNPGIAYRAVEDLFNVAKKMSNYCEINISIYMIELYIDFIYDVLGQVKDRKGINNSGHLEIKEDA